MSSNMANATTNYRLQQIFDAKVVQDLHCASCSTMLCRRGMKALLLADVSTQLYSSDMPPTDRCDLIGDIYSTDSCQCRLSDFACLSCGEIIGYHVVEPCEKCLRSCNNGHLWMFHGDTVIGSDRVDPRTNRSITWGRVGPASMDVEGNITAHVALQESRQRTLSSTSTSNVPTASMDTSPSRSTSGMAQSDRAGPSDVFGSPVCCR
eukprot:m.113829 g.113829  ORF g.113829 m.113829 type:complete len:207 (-) comp13528_c0_seq2:162-782(-)